MSNTLVYKITGIGDFESLRLALEKGEHTHYTACHNGNDYYTIDIEKTVLKDGINVPAYVKVPDCTPIVNPYYKAPISVELPEINTKPIEIVKELEAPIEAPTIDYKELYNKKCEEIDELTKENQLLKNNLTDTVRITDRVIKIISKMQQITFSGSDLLNIIKDE